LYVLYGKGIYPIVTIEVRADERNIILLSGAFRVGS